MAGGDRAMHCAIRLLDHLFQGETQDLSRQNWGQTQQEESGEGDDLLGRLHRVTTLIADCDVGRDCSVMR